MTRSHAEPAVVTNRPGDAVERTRHPLESGARVPSPPRTAAAERGRALPVSATTVARVQAAVTAVAPVVMAAGLLHHPDLGIPTDPRFLATLASAVEADPGGWALAHLAVAVGSGLLILAFLAVRTHLREAGEDRWSVLALPFVVMGSVLFALLPAMEFAPLAAAEAGVDIQAVQGALMPWLNSTLRISAVIFGLGTLGFAAGIARSRILNPALTWIAVGALVVLAAARFVPLVATRLYVGPAAEIMALWPLAYAMWRRGEEAS